MTYRKNKLLIFVIVVILSIPLPSESISTRFINFQGRLTDQQGNPLDGTYTIKFSLYSSSDINTSPLWAEEHTNVNVSNGIVNVLLGSIQSFDEPVKVTFDQERYLGITIDCDHDPNTKEFEMTPRQRILPAIYAYTAGTAYNADNADKLDGKDSSEFTTPEKDAGRPGVVQNLYEGNVRLADKYIKAEGGTITGDLNINGNVGIGTTEQQRALHVKGGSSGYGTIIIDENPAIDEAMMGFYDDTAGTDTNDAWVIGQGGWGNAGDFVIGNENNGVGGNVRLLIEKYGNVGIGTTSPNYKLHVVGDIAYTGNIYHPSDIRLKENINPIENAVEKVSSLNGIYFNYKKESAEKREVGVIAQEVEKVIPEVVSSDTDGYKSVDYSKLTPLLIEAIKAQQAQIQDQQGKIEDLQTRIQAIENR